MGLRFPELLDVRTWRWQSCQPYTTTAFAPREDPWYSFLLEVKLTARPNGKFLYIIKILQVTSSTTDLIQAFSFNHLQVYRYVIIQLYTCTRKTHTLGKNKRIVLITHAFQLCECTQHSPHTSKIISSYNKWQNYFTKHFLQMQIMIEN
jgi:hypothetical protein